MTMSRDQFEKTFGLSWHSNGAEIAKRLCFIENAGAPTGTITPEFIGQQCFDTANSDFYVATGLAAANWKKLTP